MASLVIKEERLPLLGKSTTNDHGLGDLSPSELGGCLSNVFFSWLTPLLDLGNKRPLEFDDLYQLNADDRAVHISKEFKKYWDIEMTKSKPRLWWALARGFGGPFVAAGFLKLIHDSLQFVGPMVIKAVIEFLSDPDAELSTGLYYALAIFVAGIIQSFSLRQYFFLCFETGLRFRSAIVTAVYKKSLVLAASAKAKKSTGEITNLMSIDAQRLQEITNYLHAIWYALFQITISSYLLYLQLGVSFIAGVIIMLLIIPATAAISQMMRTLQRALMLVKDERVKVVYEVLSGIKVIKLQAWENSFTNRVMQFRSSELDRLRTYIYARAGASMVYNGVPSLVTVASFFAYIYLGNTLDVGTALTSLSLFNILRFPLFMLPNVINSLVEAQVSFARLEEFFMMEEREPVTPGSLTDVSVQIQHADFEWDAALDVEAEQVADGPILKNVNLKLQDGTLCAVVGAVGSGKSTLVSGILGDARCAKGQVHRFGSVAYVSQQPFIQNATLRDNITFGLPFDHAKYQNAVSVSCLADDLKILPGGDMTEIGEKGINLSGGQRTRVAIARAVYQDADIYLLDDPLAAVDAHVGSDIFKQCIKTALKGKLVILVTNGLNFLKDCDEIVVLEKGNIVEHGSYSELLEKTDGVLTQMMESVQEAPEKEAHDGDNEHNEDEETFEARERTESTRSDVDADKSNNATLIADEDRSVGDVPWSTYQVWIDACGGLGMGFLVIFMYILTNCVNLSSTFWLSYWSENANDTSHGQFYYLYIFMAFNAGLIVMMFIQSLTLYLTGLRGSTLMFNQLMTQVLRAPMSFFDTTPLGRIVNRMSKDVYAIDETIPANWGMLFGTVFSVLTTICTVVYVTPWFSIILLPLGILYYASQRYFIKTSRELQRLDSISRSPVYALLTETLEGMPTIRAFGVENQFASRNEIMLDRNQRAYFLNFSANCWLALRLEFAGTMVATSAALFAVLGHEANAGVAFAGLAGVSLSYAFNVTQSLNWSVRMLSTIQTQMVSVERIHTYTTMPVEAELKAEPLKQLELENAKWPAKGAITFNNVDLRYRSGLPRVLRKLTFSINAKEKIGIVGRTGAGKSSLVVALMRLVELDAGEITLDGVNISSIGLHDLRDKISIIPQDPVLFSGTIRSNLDPFDRYGDDAIWTAIKRANLHNAVTSLDDKVDERGQNFSVGERQLICIARALLKKSRVILMDEATASIDPNTDRLIQESIRESFKECTCLTIAHRINTILDSDRILVMDKGSAAEFDSPSQLLKNPKGIFTNLVEHWRDDSSDAKALYDFTIPVERIAQRPRPFGQHKLLVFDKKRDAIEHTSFEELPSLLQEGDLLVLNDTRVVPAQVRLVEPIVGECSSFLFLDPLYGTTTNMEVLLSSRVDIGSVLTLPGGLTFRVDELIGGDPEVHRGTLFGLDQPLHEYLAGIGEMPLPPYVERVPDKEDEKSYQTSVAQVPGAIAAPTAGLHFYPALLERLKNAGINHVCVTLHVGYGTFRSFSTEFIEQHRMDRERYHVSAESGAAIHQALKDKRRVFAVGTTATRVLETCADSFLAAQPPSELTGEASLFIYPPYQFKVLSGLFTNFHYPKTSVLTLTAAMCGSREALIDRIYKEAMERDYLWYSYGDGMLVL